MSERLIADIPYNIVELAVHDWVEEKKGEIADMIINRLSSFVAEINNNPHALNMELTFVSIEQTKKDLMNVNFKISEGRCLECDQHVQGYQPPTGSFAPEACQC